MTFDQWYTKPIRIQIDRLSMRKDSGESAARLIWESAQEQLRPELQHLRNENSNYGWILNPDRMGS